jgi:hypothetical protein
MDDNRKLPLFVIYYTVKVEVPKQRRRKRQKLSFSDNDDESNGDGVRKEDRIGFLGIDNNNSSCNSVAPNPNDAVVVDKEVDRMDDSGDKEGALATVLLMIQKSLIKLGEPMFCMRAETAKSQKLRG